MIISPITYIYIYIYTIYIEVRDRTYKVLPIVDEVFDLLTSDRAGPIILHDVLLEIDDLLLLTRFILGPHVEVQLEEVVELELVHRNSIALRIEDIQHNFPLGVLLIPIAHRVAIEQCHPLVYYPRNLEGRDWGSMAASALEIKSRPLWLYEGA
jgi:hypothetical protein